MGPLPSINKVYSIVVQEEINNSTSSSVSNVEIIAYSTPLIALLTRTVQKFCAICNRTGNTVEFCYKKHGHPTFNKQHS